MEKYETPNKMVSMATYDPRCPFDMAQRMYDEYVTHQGRPDYLIAEVIEDMADYGCCNDFGNKLHIAFDFIRGFGPAWNEGIPQRCVDEYVEFYEWQKENGLNTTKTEKNLSKMFANNVELNWDKAIDIVRTSGQMAKASD